MINRFEISLKKSHLISRPVEVMLEPTAQCNSNCIMCTKRYFREKDQPPLGFLSWEIFWKVRPFFKFARRVLFSGFGEPFLHPEFINMLNQIKRYNTFVYCFTNGLLMNEEMGRALVNSGMDMINISFGGATKETYEKIRGIDGFDTVINNLQYITEYKNKAGKIKPLLSFNVVAMNSIMPELEQLLLLAKKIGVQHFAMPNLIVQSEPMKEESIWGNKEKTDKAFRRARALAAELNINFTYPSLDITKRDCLDLFRKMFITWDGLVLSCAQERYIIGDLQKNKITSIWNSDNMLKLRRKYYKNGLDSICPGCPCFDNRPDTFLNSRINSRMFAQRIP